MYLRISALFLVPIALSAVDLRPRIDLRSRIDALLASTANIALRENISRFIGNDTAARELDSFDTEVSIADGVEQYSAVRGAHRTYRHVDEIGGLWSFGEIVTMLRTTRDIVGAMPEQEMQDRTLIRFHGSSAGHQWFVNARHRIYWLDFEGCINVSASGEIERLTWTTHSAPAGSGIASILWDVKFGAATVAGKVYTLPSDSVYRVVRKGSSRAEWNLTRYAALGRYGSEVNLQYALGE